MTGRHGRATAWPNGRACSRVYSFFAGLHRALAIVVAGDKARSLPQPRCLVMVNAPGEGALAGLMVGPVATERRAEAFAWAHPVARWADGTLRLKGQVNGSRLAGRSLSTERPPAERARRADTPHPAGWRRRVERARPKPEQAAQRGSGRSHRPSCPPAWARAILVGHPSQPTT